MFQFYWGEALDFQYFVVAFLHPSQIWDWKGHIQNYSFSKQVDNLDWYFITQEEWYQRASQIGSTFGFEATFISCWVDQYLITAIWHLSQYVQIAGWHCNQAHLEVWSCYQMFWFWASVFSICAQNQNGINFEPTQTTCLFCPRFWTWSKFWASWLLFDSKIYIWYFEFKFCLNTLKI